MRKNFQKKNNEFNYKQYDRKVLFGPFFWLHLFLELVFIVSPFLFSWKLILLGVILLELQFVIFDGCLINKLHFSKDKEAVFLYPYLKMLGVDISYQNVKMLMRYVVPVVILAVAILWQIVMKNVPIVNFGV